MGTRALAEPTACRADTIGTVHISDRELLDALREQQLRITAPRRAICGALARHHNMHLTVDDLHRFAEEDSSTHIDRSTVYRTIEALETAGLVTHMHLGHGAAVYHLAEEAHHHHLLCETCGSTTTVDDDDFTDMLALVTERTGFLVNSHHFAMPGKCADCVAKV